jgi:hypothetical protein
VKNITVSLPDDVYRNARIQAAERDTSVSALVREFLSVIGSEANRRKTMIEVIQSIRAAHPNFRASDNLDRDAVHDRNALR